MGSEKSLWTTLRNNTPEGVLFQRHEDLAGEGIPDVSGVLHCEHNNWQESSHCWVELKHSHEYPKRGGPARLRHFTPAQRSWLTERGSMGANCYVLWQIQRDYYLFNWSRCDLLGELNKKELQMECDQYHKGRANWPKIIAGFFNKSVDLFE